MKTIANCTPKEFAAQAVKITDKIKSYADGLKKFKEQITKATKSQNNGGIFDMISYICGDNVDETMDLCGMLCFMTGEEFANLNPESGDEDGIAALADIVSSKRCVSFFTMLVQLAKFSNGQ